MVLNDFFSTDPLIVQKLEKITLDYLPPDIENNINFYKEWLD